MKGYKDNIEKLTTENEKFRQVLYTGKNMQLVLMALKPNEEIGAEVHDEHDQFFRFESGVGKVMIDDNEYEVKDGDAVIVPAGEILKLYTLYSPPEHRRDVVQATKEEALADDEHFDGQLSE